MSSNTLGKHIQTYALDQIKAKESRNQRIAFAGLFGSFGFIVLAIGFIGIVQGSLSPVIGIAFAIIIAIFVGVVIYTARKRSPIYQVTEANVHEKGLHLKSKKTEADVIWDDIQSVTEISILNQSSYGVTQSTGSTLVLNDDSKYTMGDDIIDYLKLRQQLLGAVSPYIQRSAKTALENEGAFSIGDWTFSRDMIANPKGKSISWNEVSSITFRKGYMMVKSQGKTWAESKTRDLPNITILLPLLQSLQSNKIKLDEMPFESHVVTKASSDKVSMTEVR